MTTSKHEIGATELRVGDTIEVWWKPGSDTITSLTPYAGPLACIKGGFIAEFALSHVGMTIEPGSYYTVVSRR